MKKLIITKIILLTLMISYTCSYSSDFSSLYKKKINPRGQLFIKELKEKGLWKIPLSIIVEVVSEKDISKLMSLNLKMRFSFANFCTMDILVEDLDSLLSLPYVKSIYIANYGHRFYLEKSQHRKVIIGIIDKGIYWRSRIFFDNERRTRIIYFWDQTGPKSTDFSYLPYGSEYNGIQLEKLWDNHKLLKNTFGHGTLIAGIVAGNVDVKDPDGGSFFTEKKLNTLIILVNTTGRADHVLDAVAYIVSKAKQMDANCIINFSYGKHYGPHDGSDFYCRALDALLNERSVMVVPGGNDGKRNIHSKRLLMNSTTFEFILKDLYEPEDLKESNNIGLNIELWFERDINIDVFLESPGKSIFGPVNNEVY